MDFIFSEKGLPVDADQEMIAIGVGQFIGSFLQSMPTTGSFSRCAVNAASGVRTPLGGVFTGNFTTILL
jgi:sodium-independent sulfate anion transporter 11